MRDEPRFPDLDVAKIASVLVEGAQQTSREGGEMRILVTADQARWLARKRASLALGSFPLFLLLGYGALLISLKLALVAVLSAFFAYACISIARRQRSVAREAVDFEIAVRGNVLHLAGQAPRPISRAIDRPDYLRLISSESRIVALWLDNRRDPSASFDLPTSPESRRVLGEALRAAGVEVTTERPAQRIVVLTGSVAIGLLGLTAARVLLRLAATVILLSPMFWVFFGGIGVLVWLSQRRRA